MRPLVSEMYIYSESALYVYSCFILHIVVKDVHAYSSISLYIYYNL